MRPISLRWAATAAVAALCVGTSATASAATASTTSHAAKPKVASSPEFYRSTAKPAAWAQVQSLTAQKRFSEAKALLDVVKTPAAVWVDTSTVRRAERQVRQITTRAAREGSTPVLVLYNVPFRDCAQYSAGGATSVAAYKEWVDGVAKGIGNRTAMIAVEPDGLGIIPWYTSTVDGSKEWCQPAEADAATAANERFVMLNYAVKTLKALPRTKVYLDGTNSAWLNIGELSSRLVKAGVDKADGFFLNASNYQWNQNSTQYGTWTSSCIAYATKVVPGDFANCGNQFWSGGPANNWTGVALDQAKVWSETATDPTANTAGINSRYASQLGSVAPTKTFVIDSSRNGLGPWTPTGVEATWPDPQTWCNPAGRAVGTKPTKNTGNALLDAYVWIKVPGESDGQCSRGLGVGNNVVDPIWDQVDPAAGEWFPEVALQLATNGLK